MGGERWLGQSWPRFLTPLCFVPHRDCCVDPQTKATGSRLFSATGWACLTSSQASCSNSSQTLAPEMLSQAGQMKPNPRQTQPGSRSLSSHC